MLYVLLKIMKPLLSALLLLATTGLIVAETQHGKWEKLTKSSLVKEGKKVVRTVTLKPDESISFSIDTEEDHRVGYVMNPQFNISESKNFVMMSSKSVGECGGAVGASAVCTPHLGKITVKFKNRGKTVEKFIVYTRNQFAEQDAAPNR